MFHVRAHEFGPTKPRVRIWTDDSNGQFNVVAFDDVEKLKMLLDKMGVGSITPHHCDGHEDCKCRPFTYGEAFEI